MSAKHSSEGAPASGQADASGCTGASGMVDAAFLRDGSWISVQDRLPDDGDLTLCWEPRKGNTFVSQFMTDLLGGPGWTEEFYERSDTGYGFWPFITHWQPLPEAPRVLYWGGRDEAHALPRPQSKERSPNTRDASRPQLATASPDAEEHP